MRIFSLLGVVKATELTGERIVEAILVGTTGVKVNEVGEALLGVVLLSSETIEIAAVERTLLELDFLERVSVAIPAPGETGEITVVEG